jgi:hypothetical protein
MKVDYKETMAKAKEKLKESLLNIKRKNVIPSDKTDLFDKICKSRSELSLEIKSEELKSIYCLDDLWKDIENVLDGVKDNKDHVSLGKYRKDFKKILDKLQEVGIPFVGDRSICFWSSNFARDRAREYSKHNYAVTDGIAQEYMREIFLGFKDKDNRQQNVLFEILRNGTPNSPAIFPEIPRFFWSVMSEYYAEQIKKGDTVHLFFQDSITVGNFFWNEELVVARSKGAKIMLHQYNIKDKSWVEPVNIDDAKNTQEIFLRRREIHPIDNAGKDKVIELSGQIVWKQEYEEFNLDKPITAWHAPQKITLPRMKEITQNIRKYKYKLQSDLFTLPKIIEEKKLDLPSIKKATVEIIQFFIKKIDVDMRPHYEKSGIGEQKLFSKADKNLKAAFPEFLKSISSVGELKFFEIEKKSLSEIATAINSLLIGKKYFSNELLEFLQNKAEQLPSFKITSDKMQPFQWSHEVIELEKVAAETQTTSL